MEIIAAYQKISNSLQHKLEEIALLGALLSLDATSKT
jgi:hypothetical protein